MLTEKQLWQKLNTAFSSSLETEIILTRIETGSTKKGVPDLCYTNGVINGWIELKTPRRLTPLLSLTTMQLMWAKYHPNSFFVICYNNTLLILDFKTVSQLPCLQGLQKNTLLTELFLERGVEIPKKNQSNVIRKYLTPFLTLKEKIAFIL